MAPLKIIIFWCPPNQDIYGNSCFHTLRSQTLANMIEIFQNISRTFTFYLVVLRALFGHLNLHCFSAEAYSEPFQTSKMKCFCVPSERV